MGTLRVAFTDGANLKSKTIVEELMLGGAQVPSGGNVVTVPKTLLTKTGLQRRGISAETEAYFPQLSITPPTKV